MPPSVVKLRVYSEGCIDSIQLIEPNSTRQKYGGKGGKEYIWDCTKGVTKILISHGRFMGYHVITGLCFCNGTG